MAEFIHARNFKELVAYQVAFDLSRKVFELSKAFPEEEKFSLTSQIRRRLLQGMMDKAGSFCSSSRVAETASADCGEWEDPLTTDN